MFFGFEHRQRAVRRAPLVCAIELSLGELLRGVSLENGAERLAITEQVGPDRDDVAHSSHPLAHRPFDADACVSG